MKTNYLVHLNLTLKKELTSKDIDQLEQLLRAFYANEFDDLDDVVVADYEDITE